METNHGTNNSEDAINLLLQTNPTSVSCKQCGAEETEACEGLKGIFHSARMNTYITRLVLEARDRAAVKQNIEKQQALKAEVEPTWEDVTKQAEVDAERLGNLARGDMTFMLGEVVEYNASMDIWLRARVLNCVGSEVILVTQDGRTWFAQVEQVRRLDVVAENQAALEFTVASPVELDK